MCLISGWEYPLTNYKSMVVRKELICGDRYFTPYQKEQIIFKNGYAIQEVNEFGVNALKDETGREIFYMIEEGIHSYSNEAYGTNLFYAVIPKNVDYYTGMDGKTFCSEKLIIFKNWFWFVYYHYVKGW